jgi:hypothetical protein
MKWFFAKQAMGSEPLDPKQLTAQNEDAILKEKQGTVQQVDSFSLFTVMSLL